MTTVHNNLLIPTTLATAKINEWIDRQPGTHTVKARALMAAAKRQINSTNLIRKPAREVLGEDALALWVEISGETDRMVRRG